jgi:hypothetical protein
LRGIFTENREDKLIVNDLTTFIKLKSSQFTVLKVLSMYRIRQNKIEEMIRKRYPAIDLRVKETGVNFYSNHMIKKVIDTPRLQETTIYLRQKGKVTY